MSQPEVLALVTLTYGQGLPVGPAELEMIERARAKRIWEASLPPVTDAESYQKRLKMMEDMELKEWAYREQEIKRLQDARIEILKKVIRNREGEIESVNRERMGKIWQKKLQEREALREKIEKKKAKSRITFFKIVRAFGNCLLLVKFCGNLRRKERIQRIVWNDVILSQSMPISVRKCHKKFATEVETMLPATFFRVQKRCSKEWVKI